MELIALAIAPGIAICLFIFHRDAYNREPKLNLFASFMLGLLVIFPVADIEIFFCQFANNTTATVAMSHYRICNGGTHRRIGEIHCASLLCLSKEDVLMNLSTVLCMV